MVGAVVVDAGGRMIAEGFHQEYGGPHAEVHALAAAGEAARDGTLYVSLEPCAHHGRTPPCCDAILRAGIARVVIGARDPNPEAAGGVELLRRAGIAVSEPVAESAVRRQNAIFFHAHEKQRTFVSLKLAVSLDGRVAATPGSRTSITGEKAQTEVHRLRAVYDAIMVGRGTVSADDPLLTVRGAVTPPRPPVRVIVDTQLRTALESQLLGTIDQAPVWLYCAADVDEARRAELERAGARVRTVPRSDGGLNLQSVLHDLWEQGIRSVFCEGGARLAGALARNGLLDRLQVFVAPMLLGSGAVNAFDALPEPERVPLQLERVERFGSDVLLTYDRANPDLAAVPIGEGDRG
jgi:diaminohydroxyphosphoribosylaminopyrimidine deaminase/5-amino-6-(5-phosphoribosylamino)uracil reductase